MLRCDLRSTGFGGYKAGMGTVHGPLSADVSGPVFLALAEADDAALARAAVLGDARAPREIWRRFVPLVRRIVRRTLGPEHDVEDVVQDVFLRLFDKLPGLRDPEALRAFLVSISIRSVRYELRRRRVRRLVGLSPTPELNDLRVVSTDHESRQALLHLYRLLNRLSFRERTAFVLRFVEDMDIEQVASALEVSVPTTRRALARAWERISVLAGDDGFLTRYVEAASRGQS
jgi:RNA polymerase sigma-70 factor (ECF subfamily)